MTLLIAISAWLAATSAFAQGGTADISGTVFDQQKAVLPGVTVTVTNEATGQERTTVSEVDGRFTIPTLLPGTYTVRAELQGFQTTTQQGLVVAVGQEVTLDLTLRLAGVQESVTVTAEAPLVEATASRIGVNITSRDIDNLPAFNRSQFSLMTTIPGLVPALQPGAFEGGQYSANGQATTSNLFLVDGQFNNDSRLGGAQGTQARISLDSMAEYQVQTHQYGAEYGGSTGVVVNTVSRSGTNNVFGRAFEYYQGNALQATDYFLKQAGEENPDSSSHVFGGNVGGPIVQNRLFYFGNFEYTNQKQAANLNFPADAAPLAVPYSNYTKFTGPNTYLRLDFQASTNHRLKFSWLREAILTQNDELEGDLAILDASRHENDAGDIVYNFSWTSVLSNRATNEVRVGRVQESLRQGPRVVFDDNWKFIGFAQLDPLTLGPQNSHPDYLAGNRNTYGQNEVRDFTIDDSLTFIKSGWGGEHTVKTGFSFMRNPLEPSGVAANFIGNYMFPTNTPFNAANPRSYPWRFQVAMGQVNFDVVDYRVGGYVSDKWAVSRNLTLNIGVRYDWQDAVPETKDAFGPRFGFAYNVGGADRTVVRGGVGRVYQYQQLAVLALLARGTVIAPTVTYDTGQVASPAVTGALPTGTTADRTACLQPAAGSKAGVAVISPACRTFLEGMRNQVLGGGFVNTTTTGPLVDGDRRMAYTWNFSIGVKHEVMRDTAVSVDYVGNRGYDNTSPIDINEGPLTAAGRITRPGVAAFDPASALVTGSARTAAFQGFYQYQTLDALNSDFDSLELGLEKRYSNRWSGRVSYTLARCRDVINTPVAAPAPAASFTNDRDPRRDYGACLRDNRHAFATSANVEIWRGLGAGMLLRAYSGYPINETIGSDVNGDGINNDRPVRGVNDLTRPILSEVDAQGTAVRNGIDGPNKVSLDARAQYIWRFQRTSAGVFLEVYNLTNHVNYGAPTGNRNSSVFMVPIVTDDPLTAQIGVRFTF
ncbi:MAG: TonB-dependent receptor [Acidobacteria bacterium]|nr:TonB-dependent receptor [Acidobacteriota bacterium]